MGRATAGERESVLRLSGITKRFGALLANDDISLTLQRGEILGLLGENGAGKTTLMNILFGHYVADAGEIEVEGKVLPPGLPAAALAFFVLATANSGGYRYGISDQAFYQPAIVHALQPELFPRDTPLLEAQTRLMLGDDALAAASRVAGLDLPALFFGVYVLSLVALFGAAVAFANALGPNRSRRRSDSRSTLASGPSSSMRSRLP